MNLEEVKQAHDLLSATLKAGQEIGIGVTSVSARIITKKGEREAAWIVMYDVNDNLTVSRQK